MLFASEASCSALFVPALTCSVHSELLNVAELCALCATAPAVRLAVDAPHVWRKAVCRLLGVKDNRDVALDAVEFPCVVGGGGGGACGACTL